MKLIDKMEKETALKILRELHDNALFSERTALETLIPELKDSEDERIRKQLLNWFKDCKWDAIDNETLKRDDIIAWLEKQGERIYWKSSEEQMQTLHAQLNEGAVTYSEDRRVLSTLYEDLMKIMTQEEKQGEQKPINECNKHELTIDEARKWNDAYEKGYSLGYENGMLKRK